MSRRSGNSKRSLTCSAGVGWRSRGHSVNVSVSGQDRLRAEKRGRGGRPPTHLPALEGFVVELKALEVQDQRVWQRLDQRALLGVHLFRGRAGRGWMGGAGVGVGVGRRVGGIGQRALLRVNPQVWLREWGRVMECAAQIQAGAARCRHGQGAALRCAPAQDSGMHTARQHNTVCRHPPCGPGPRTATGSGRPSAPDC